MSSVLKSLHATTALARVQYPDATKIPAILNTHTHPRDTDEEGDGRAEMHLPLWAEVAHDILAMGNTKVPLTTSVLAQAKKQQWQKLVPSRSPLRIHVAGLMTEHTDPSDVVAGYDRLEGQEVWIAMKMFIRSASNAHGADVDDLSKMIHVLRAMTDTSKFIHKKRPMPLCLHLERKHDVFGRRVHFLHRERESMGRDLLYLLNEVPGAHLIVCHVSDAYTVALIRHLRSLGHNVWGEIAPHYTIWTCDDLFEGPGGGTMFNSCLFCLPVFKTEADRLAVEGAMLSGEPWWIYGSDGACWLTNPSLPAGVKINRDGFVIGGQTQIERANISYVIERFAEAGKLEHLGGYVSHNGRDALGLPHSAAYTRFVRQDWTVDKIIRRSSPTLGELEANVAMGGMLRRYMPDLQAA